MTTTRQQSMSQILYKGVNGWPKEKKKSLEERKAALGLRARGTVPRWETEFVEPVRVVPTRRPRVKMDPCTFQHDWDFELEKPACSHCGEPYVFGPRELYRWEKMRRGLPLQKYLPNGRPYKARGQATCLRCPGCYSRTIILGQFKQRGITPRRWARCCACQYSWITMSKEAFGGTRQVEVRG